MARRERKGGMMREILFKAKRKDNGEWVEGLPGYDINGKITEIEVYKKVFDCRIYEIDPNTLCQFTGLTDKNGRKIWENDIIKTSQYGVDNGDGRNFAGFDIFSISFSECSFCLMNKWRRFNLRPNRDMEAIGNIFDNPDLLEEEP